MGMISIANLKKAAYYLRRNGVKNTWYAARERLEEGRKPPYCYVPPDTRELEAQRQEWTGQGRERTGQDQEQTRQGIRASDWDGRIASGEEPEIVTFSIVVPTYQTGEQFLVELVESLFAQTYPHWELILADASADDSVAQVARRWEQEGSPVERDARPWEDGRIRYCHLASNGGIAGNTNAGIALARGAYVGLLDHDDLLTQDALHHMARAILARRQEGVEPGLLYSDEDKCNGDGSLFFEPNEKEDFNLDLLLCNNYICHFLVMKRELIQELGFRQAYDGAQDYDLVLRAAERLLGEERQMVHIPRVLYHWRCHAGSTAENPASKQYAYEAGGRAVQDFAYRQGWKAKVYPMKHLGFYRLHYEGEIFASRPDLGAVGGRVLEKGRVAGGRMSAQGEVYYEGLREAYSGYLHRAVLFQDAQALDIRCIQVRKECRELFRQVVGVPYRTRGAQGKGKGELFDASTLPGDCDWRSVSLALSQALRERGYRLLYDPERGI